MDVIPVIDVRHGLAVRAVGGRRDDYRPLETPLAEGSDPVAVGLGFMSLFAFPVLYVADLDGIEGRGANADLPGRLAAALPGAKIWIDDGTAPQEAGARLASASAATLVVGSESVRNNADLKALHALPAGRYVLSLDFSADRFLGPAELLTDAMPWPSRVIVMTLARVGGGEGPDLRRLADIIARAGRRSVYAAGGVRDRADVEALRKAGAAGVLVASALHTNAIRAGDLQAIAGR
jgi:phosphoribosylformimino-5-aminoimidazole carboxamide ribotide isomerase